MAPVINNNISKDIKELNIPPFKRKLRLKLIDKCFYNIMNFFIDNS